MLKKKHAFQPKRNMLSTQKCQISAWLHLAAPHALLAASPEPSKLFPTWN